MARSSWSGASAQNTDLGLLIRRALDIRSALKLGVRIGMDEIGADEFYAMLILEEERERLEHSPTPR